MRHPPDAWRRGVSRFSLCFARGRRFPEKLERFANSDLSDAFANAPAMRPNGFSHGLAPVSGASVVARTVDIFPIPVLGAFAASCVAQCSTCRNRKNLCSVRSDGCPASVTAHVGLQKKKMQGSFAGALAKASDKSEFGFS